MAYDKALADRIADVFTSQRVDFEIKAMMGGLCFMVDGKMCVGVTDRRLMVRLDPEIEIAVMKRAGCKPMDFTGRPKKGYVFVDPGGTHNEAALCEWLKLALDFNPKAKSSRKPST